MGAQFDYRTYTLEDFKIVQEKWENDVRTSLSESGGLYSGKIGMLGSGITRSSKKFDSAEQAIIWMEENHEKWGAALAVQYKTKIKQPSTMGKKIKDKIDGLIEEIQVFDNDILTRIKSAKSITIGCKKCGSKITRSYLCSTNCPICNNIFYTVTDVKRLNTKKTKLQELHAKLREEKPKLTDGYGWMIGGWCSC